MKVGDPWSILPVKNAKYARDLVEVHLSDRELDSLEHFEDFPNLEVIWLNNNKVTLPSFIVTAEKPGRNCHQLQSEEGLRAEQRD